MDLIDDWAGSDLAARMTQAAYDSLPWTERETLGRYVLAGTGWGASIADQFASALGEQARLLRGVPFLAGLSNRDFYLVQAALEYEEVPAGKVVARRGSPIQRFVLVQSGEIEVWQPAPSDSSERLVDELRRGASFGSELFIGEESHKATYRTSVDTEILTISAAELARLRRAGVEIDAHGVGILSTAYLLGRMPIFADLSPKQISDLAERMKRVSVDEGQVIVRQGEPRQYFYVIVEGQVGVGVRDETGQESIVAHLGEGEHFGEAALYADQPYTATYQAETPVELLTLDEPTFDNMVASSRQVARYVEQISSGRALDTRRKLHGVTTLSSRRTL
jgi:CRP-like cAMP-binding protein